MKRILILIIVVIILAVGGYFLYNRFILSNADKQTKQSAINTAYIAATQADKEAVYAVTNNFFTKYISCIKNPPSFAKGTVANYCQDNTGFTTSAFVSNLKKGGVKGADPIFCSQNIPDTVASNTNITTNGNKAESSASEKFGSQEKSVSVTLQKVNGIWKVDNITCTK